MSFSSKKSEERKEEGRGRAREREDELGKRGGERESQCVE